MTKMQKTIETIESRLKERDDSINYRSAKEKEKEERA